MPARARKEMPMYTYSIQQRKGLAVHRAALHNFGTPEEPRMGLLTRCGRKIVPSAVRLHQGPMTCLVCLRSAISHG